MTLTAIFVGILIAFSIIVGVLFVLFGQITVRKLRKKPETKDALGIEFASGWDILNVAKVLAIPKSLAQKLNKSSQSAFYADVDLLYKHTTTFDRLLGAVFYWLYVFTGLSMILLVLMNALDFFI